MNNIQNVKQIVDIEGKKVLVRVDFNVPVENGKVMDDYRIKKSLPNIQYLKDKGAKVLLISHIEAKVGEKTLKPVAEYLQNIMPLKFLPDFFSDESKNAIGEMQNGDVILFENLRKNKGEEKNDDAFSKELASLADIYVNDAFAVSHRAHASVVGVPKFLPHYAGLLLASEIENLSKVFNPEHPFLFILGGAKFDTKLPLIQKFLSSAEKIFVGGALANDIYKEMGFNVGKSLVSGGNVDLKEIIQNEKIIVPSDVIVKNGAKDENSVSTKKPEEVIDEDIIMDAGESTLRDLEKEISKMKTILWNGPLGNYELGFTTGTTGLAKIVGASNAKSIVGGGDTLAAIASLGVEDKITFISTGGGAMLEYLLNETLPGIDALKN